MFRNLQQKSPINLKYAEMISQNLPQSQDSLTLRIPNQNHLVFWCQRGSHPPRVTQARAPLKEARALPCCHCQGSVELESARLPTSGSSNVGITHPAESNFLENFSGIKKIHWFMGMKLPMIPKHQTKKTVGWNWSPDGWKKGTSNPFGQLSHVVRSCTIGNAQNTKTKKKKKV